MCLKFCEDYLGVYIFIKVHEKHTLFSVGRIVTRLPIYIVHVVKSKFPS